MEIAPFRHLSYLRRILKCASNRASWFELLFMDKFTSLVRQVKIEKSAELQEMLESCSFLDKPVIEMLKLGYTVGLRYIVNAEVDVSSPGRLVASMAFLAHVMDVWEKNSDFLPDFILDSVAITLWQMINFRLKAMELGEEEGE
ncbi:putative E1B 19 kDa protein [red squirrel adenovirus 1]|uniref:E1B protein, small T-antigen n=1 Tax=red squirrel adenovirus 1 TaxID=2773314 RepID=A0A240FBF7_9ADEN|nr:putative E1B 19 kDa protein [red squirrel adenovirus 1]ARE31877.1 putative E1B 19 kDa protein [red squirrel adenovirus 1]